MISNQTLAIIICYIALGGRISFVLAGGVFYLISPHHHQLQPQQETPSLANGRANKTNKTTKPKASPIYAIDFTSTSFTPSHTSSIPQQAKKDTNNARSSKKVMVSRRKARSKTPKIIRASKPVQAITEPTLTTNTARLTESQINIFYTTLTGSSQRVANALFDKLNNLDDLKLPPKLLSLDDDVDDLEEYFLKTPQSEYKNIYVMVLPSYETDSPIDYFLDHLKETYQDFRVDKYPLRSLLGFSVLGLGDSESWGGSKFCYQSKLADYWLAKLGGRRIFPRGEVCMKFEGEPKANEWIQNFATLLNDNEPFYLDDEIEDSDDDNGVANDDNDDNETRTSGGQSSDETDDTLVDVEDMGKIMRKEGVQASSGPGNEVKEMVAKDSPTFNSLTKQGYTIVGSHSGVKICRWTKSALRGRGSCYKFAFYGIKSHLCMETTPSLACSNKCVFCWRHGTNPVAKLQWRWVLDPPEKVFEGALQGHYQKIKQMRGIPGIQMDRFQEAFKVRHCALSLVGEPIFYPHINELVNMLHNDEISSFLVCNAQHPEQLAQLAKVTQLYVSIDAPTRTDLRKIDRPLNSDFWERLMSCLDILRTTQSHQRTVFRLTLVKGFNMDEIQGYADMVVKAQPSQIEVKGATFCGSSNGNGNPLTMQNIPFYEECKKFVTLLSKELQARGYPYEIAAEHAHSCCILIAHEKFKINGVWHTHIDYPKFFQLLKSGEPFNDLDYIVETPNWAVYGSEEAGFNPQDTKFDRKAEKLKKKLEREEQQKKVMELKV